MKLTKHNSARWYCDNCGVIPIAHHTKSGKKCPGCGRIVTPISLILTAVADAHDAVVEAARDIADNYGNPGTNDLCDCATYYPKDCVHPKCRWRKLFEALSEAVRDE